MTTATERTKNMVEQLAAQIRAIARGEPPPAPRKKGRPGGARAPRAHEGSTLPPAPPKKPRAKRRYFPKAHPGSPVDVVDLELERQAGEQLSPMELRVDGLIKEAAQVEQLDAQDREDAAIAARLEQLRGEEPYPVTVGPISAFGTTEAAEVLASMGPVEFKTRPMLDPVIAAAAGVSEERRAQTLAAEAARAELIRRGNWKRQCKARDAENGLQCGQLEGHLVGTARVPATAHRTARGEFVRCLGDGQEASRARELAEWAQDRRDVGDVSP